MPEYCPYCNSVRSVLIGNVYCSNHGPAMEQLNSGTLFIKTKYLEETAEHISRLSIRCMLNGEQHYKVGGNDHLVTPDNFLVINQGQSYKTAFRNSNEGQMLMVAFNPDFANDVFYSLLNTDGKLLDNPNEKNEQSIAFFEKTYSGDSIISGVFSKLRVLVDEKDNDYKKGLDLNYYYGILLERLLCLHMDTLRRLPDSGAIKPATQKEIFRRISIAKDYIDAHTTARFDINALSAIACMSPHHFLRSFKKIVGITPHQYLIAQRIELAKKYLLLSELSVKDICTKVGFENPSSFIRLFKENELSTPQQFRKLHVV